MVSERKWFAGYSKLRPVTPNVRDLLERKRADRVMTPVACPAAQRSGSFTEIGGGKQDRDPHLIGGRHRGTSHRRLRLRAQFIQQRRQRGFFPPRAGAPALTMPRQ